MLSFVIQDIVYGPRCLSSPVTMKEASKHRRSHLQTKSRLRLRNVLTIVSLLVGVAWLVWSSGSMVPDIITGLNNSPKTSRVYLKDVTLPSVFWHKPRPSFQDGEEEIAKEIATEELEDDQPHVAQLLKVASFDVDASPSTPYTSPLDPFVSNTSISIPPPVAQILSVHSSKEERHINEEPYHDFRMFKMDFKDMTKRFKVFVYPHSHKDPFPNIFLPLSGEPGGNYASESYFKKALMSSHFVTRDASEASMFYLPFSISRLRHDKRVGVRGLNKFISSYITTVREKWPYWNRTAGADHFFVSCHSITKTVSEQNVYLRTNAIQVVCSSNSFLQGYVPHKDVSVPQVWPRKGTPAEAKLIKQRKVLAFFAGAANSPVRQAVVKAWSGDRDIMVHSKRIATPYSRALLTSKFCLHVRGYEVNTARVADALHFGCVPVILANHYDLPFADVLRWERFSVVISTLDIPLLKTVLQGVTPVEYEKLQKNVLQVRKHFEWNSPPLEYDAFYMVMYELWSRRHSLKPAF